MSTATPGGQKSRGGSRARVLSQEPSRVREPATHAHPRSPASSNRSTAYAPAVASPRERPSTTKPAATSSHISGLEQWQALRGAPQSDRTLPAKVVSAFQENPKQSSSPAAGNSGIKAQYPLPPIDPATAPVPTAKPISPTVKENVAPPTPAASNDVNGKAKPVTSLFAMSTSHQVAGILKNVGTKTQEASNSITGTIPKSSVEGTKAEDKATSATALAARTPLEEVKEESINGQASSSNSMFAEPRDEIAALNKRIVALEAESFNLQKQVETLLQGNERRKFLGTDSASTPFALEVKDGGRKNS